MLSIPQMLWLVKHARETDSRILLVGDSAQHRSVERGDALRVLEQSGNIRYVELLQTRRQKVPALKKRQDLGKGKTCSRTMISSKCGRSPTPSSS
jgi:ATP-dependent exoDNAse (exonuclease V) alpha subunit